MTVTVQRIVDLTEHYGTSGAFIARLCGKSRSLIAGWKDGKAAPTDSDLAAIADLYGVSVAYLRGEVDVPESSVKNALQQQLLDMEPKFLSRLCGGQVIYGSEMVE